MIIRIAAFAIVLTGLLAGIAAIRLLDGAGDGTRPSPQASQRSTSASQLVQLEQAAADRPDDLETITRLAAAYVQRARETGDPAFYGLAEQAVARAQAIDADDVQTLVVAGVLALARHDFAGALALGEQARATNPDVVAVYGVIADALIDLGRYAEAIAVVDEMADRRPDFASYSRVSYLRELHGDLDGAIEGMEQAAAAGSGLPFDEAWAQVIIGNLQLQRGDIDAAARAYRQADALLPGDAMTQAGLARLAIANGDPARAEELLRVAVTSRPLPEYAVALGELLESQGRLSEAEEQYALVRATQQLFAASGVNTDIDLALFDADPARAYDAALAAYGGRPSIYAADTIAWAAFRAGRIDEAQQYIAQAIRLGTRDPRLAYHAGEIARAAGDAAAAEQHLRAALAAPAALSPTQAQAARASLDELVALASG